MNENHFSLRVAERRDIPNIVDFNLAMALETEELSLNRETLEKGVLSVFNDTEKGFYIVVEDEEGMVAASLMITREWSDWRNSWWWWIQSVYVLPEYRRKGLFMKMYDHVQKLAARDGCAGLRLYVENTNINARKTYLRCGMEESHYLLFEETFNL